MTDNKFKISPVLSNEIDAWVAKYPPEQKQSAVMGALLAAQDLNQGYLTDDLIHAIAERLEMPVIAVYEVVTFYSMYNLSPVGRHQIKVCASISCHLNGAPDMIKHLEQRLQIKCGGTTANNQFSLKKVECLGACRNAPMMQVDKDYHEQLTPEKINALLEELS